MQIVPPQPEHVPALLDVYRAAVSRAPHCRFPPTVDDLAARLAAPHDRPPFRLVAERDGVAVGFAALDDLPEDDGAPERDAVTALFFADEAAGAALLAACESLARPGPLDAFPMTHFRCPVSGYNGGWDGLSDRIPAVGRLLSRAGYAPFYRELHLRCDLRRFSPAPAPAPPGLAAQLGAGERGTFALRARAGEREIGVCYYGTLGFLGGGADHVGYIWGLGVDAAHRRRGVARHLLTLALAKLTEMGCDECWLTTGVENWPAQPLYLSLGYEVVDGSACYRKVV